MKKPRGAKRTAGPLSCVQRDAPQARPLVFGRLGRDRHDIYHGVPGLAWRTARALRSGGARGARNGGRSNHSGRGNDSRIGRRDHRSFACAQGKGPYERDRHNQNFHDGIQYPGCEWKALHLKRAAQAAQAGPHQTGIAII